MEEQLVTMQPSARAAKASDHQCNQLRREAWVCHWHCWRLLHTPKLDCERARLPADSSWTGCVSMAMVVSGGAAHMPGHRQAVHQD